MAITTISPAVALVVIDMQKGIASGTTVHPVADIRRNVVRLADAFRERNHHVVLVTVGWSADAGDAPKNRVQTAAPSSAAAAPDFAQIIDELHPDPKRDIFIRKRQWGAFYGTDLDLQLRRRGITDIVLCGIATSIGVESTARSAWEHGYNVTFASDAMTDRVAEGHDRALSIIFPRLGEIGTTDEVLAKLP